MLINPEYLRATGVDFADGMPMPLAQRVARLSESHMGGGTERDAITRFAERYVHSGTERDGILAEANDPHTAAEPQRLIDHQVRLERYNKEHLLTSALASHFTKGVETLLKS